MQEITVLGEKIENWKNKYPLLEDIVNTREVFWVNPLYGTRHAEAFHTFTEKDIEEAENRLTRFAPFIMEAFPETEKSRGILESPLELIPVMQQKSSQLCGCDIPGRLYAKLDSHLPISGSIKARGGIYEVLHFAETIAMKYAKLSWKDNYAILKNEKFRSLFSQYSIVVGSTGNLGLSIGIMGAALGFKVVVHMSVDAKQWKKDMLRSKGVVVVEHADDYSKAVEAGRKEAESDHKGYFIDDESSKHLFLGYSVAAKRLQQQLKNLNIVVDADHPLIVYLPCGVGGGPGGVTFGLRTIFKEHVHCFFAEPTHSPAMLLGLMTGLHEKIAAQDFGIDNRTAADGLAVGRPSGLVGKILERDIAGVFTVQDDQLHLMLKMLADCENKFLEPSALAGFFGPMQLMATQSGKEFLQKRNLLSKMSGATHITWATGGSMVPQAEMNKFYQQGVQVADRLKDTINLR